MNKILLFFSLFLAFSCQAMEQNNTKNTGEKRKRALVPASQEKKNKTVKKKKQKVDLAEQENLPTGWQDLPSEVKLLIISFLTQNCSEKDALKNLKTLELVNKECRILAKEDGIVTHAITNYVNSDYSIRFAVPAVCLLNKACQSGDGACVASFLKTKVDIGNSDCLLYASQKKNRDIVQLLLNHGVLSCPNRNAQRLLTAVLLGDSSTIRELLQNSSFDINSVNCDGITALMFAANAGNEKIAQLLIDSQANLEAKSAMGRTALMFAASAGHKSMVNLLLKSGALIDNTTDEKEGETALCLACELGHVGVAELLIAKGADINHIIDACCDTIVENAAHEGKIEIVQLLIKQDDFLLGDALAVAVGRGQKDIFKLLLNYANPHQLKHAGRRFLENRRQDKEILELLINHGLDVNHSKIINTAAWCSTIEMLNLLIDNGAHINNKDKMGRTPLMNAMQNSRDVIMFLLDNGADIHAQDGEGSTVLMYALEQRATLEGGTFDGKMIFTNKDLPKILIDRGADINACDFKGITALSRVILACKPCPTGIVNRIEQALLDNALENAQLLIAHGAHVRVWDNKGKSILTYAKESNHPAMIKLLEDNGAVDFVY